MTDEAWVLEMSDLGERVVELLGSAYGIGFIGSQVVFALACVSARGCDGYMAVGTIESAMPSFVWPYYAATWTVPDYAKASAGELAARKSVAKPVTGPPDQAERERLSKCLGPLQEADNQVNECMQVCARKAPVDFCRVCVGKHGVSLDECLKTYMCRENLWCECSKTCVSAETKAASVRMELDRLVEDAHKSNMAGDAAKAAILFKQACDAGSGMGCLGIGLVELDGRPGVPQDQAAAGRHFAQALPELEIACKAGKSEACILIGSLYEDGLGTPKDTAKARQVYQKACETAPEEVRVHICARAKCVGAATAEDGGGCMLIGTLTLSDETANPRQKAKGIAFLGEGCRLGDAGSCSSAGMEYVTGLSVAKDTAVAKTYYAKACLLGQKSSCGMAELVGRLDE